MIYYINIIHSIISITLLTVSINQQQFYNKQSFSIIKAIYNIVFTHSGLFSYAWNRGLLINLLPPTVLPPISGSTNSRLLFSSSLALILLEFHLYTEITIVITMMDKTIE